MYIFIKLLERYGNVTFNSTLLSYLDYISHGAIALTIAMFFYTDWSIFFKRFFKALPIGYSLLIAGFITELITVIFWCASWYIVPTQKIVSFGFFCTTLLLASLYCRPEIKKSRFNIKNAWILGIAQGIALLPGISRFGSTFVTARWLGFSARKSFQLSFLISWPINVAAFSLGIYKLYEHQLLDLLNLKMWLVMLIGSSVALLCFKMINLIINSTKFWLFSIYTGALAFISLCMPL